MSTGLPRPGLARSAHRGRIKFLRGYVSKSSAAVNPLTITQLACERYIAGTSMRSALRGPAHQLAVPVRMRINNCTHGHNNYCPFNQPCTVHAPATVFAPRVYTLVPFINVSMDERYIRTIIRCTCKCTCSCHICTGMEHMYMVYGRCVGSRPMITDPLIHHIDKRLLQPHVSSSTGLQWWGPYFIPYAMASVLLWLVSQTHQKAQLGIRTLCLWTVITHCILHVCIIIHVHSWRFWVLETRQNIQIRHCIQREDA